MPFRDDVLRGVRLFLIAFSILLVGVWVFRMLHASADAQGAPQDLPATYEAAPADEQQPPPAAAPVSQASSEAHGLVVPPPPPIAGAHAVRAASRQRDDVPPPPPPATVVRASRAPAPSAREFEAPAPSILPAAPAAESTNASPVPVKKVIGYKSLIEANANRLPVDPGARVADEEPAEQPQKGNRFFRAIGKIFHPQREPMPMTLQPKEQ